MAVNGKKYLKKEDILAGSIFRCHEVEIGESKLRIRELSAEEWLDLGKEEREAQKDVESDEHKDDTSYGLALHFGRISRLVCKTAVDDKGKRVFDDGDDSMIQEKLGAETLMEIYKLLATVAPPATGGVTGGSSARTSN